MLTTAERMRIFQIVSIHAYERAGPAKKWALDELTRGLVAGGWNTQNQRPQKNQLSTNDGVLDGMHEDATKEAFILCVA